jgi:uncharacterized protein
MNQQHDMNQPTAQRLGPFAKTSKSLLTIWILFFPGFAIYSLRMLYEKFYLTWLYGPQMLGFSFIHTWGIVALYALLSTLIIHAWLVLCAILLIFTKATQKRSLTICFALGLLAIAFLYTPAEWIQPGTQLILGPPKRIVEVCMAADAGDLALLESLIAQGAEVNGRCGPDDTPLTVASTKGHTRVVKFLLEHGADVEKKGSYGQTALSADFTFSPNREVIEVLLQHGANINNQDSDGRTVLMGATYANDTTQALYIISKGANVSLKSLRGETALRNASRRGNQVLVDALKKAGAND